MVSDVQAAKMLDNNAMVTAAIAKHYGTRTAKIRLMSTERLGKYWLAATWQLMVSGCLLPHEHCSYVTLGDGRNLHAQDKPPPGLQLTRTAATNQA